MGVIGVGNMGSNHARIISSEESRFELVGVFDIDDNNSKNVAEKFGTKSYEDVNDLIDDADAISIAVPSTLHKKYGELVARRRVHALIEKPLAVNSDDAKYLTDIFANSGVILQVGHVERFNPVLVELKKIIGNEPPFFIEVQRYAPFSGSGRITDTNVIEDLMIHDIDLVCYLMSPKKVTDIRANGEIIMSDKIDFATCMLDFGDKAHAILNTSRVFQGKKRWIELHSNNSFITADLLERKLEISKSTEIYIDIKGRNAYKQDGIVQKVYVPIEEPLREEFRSFYEAILNKRPVEMGGVEAMQAIKICEEINERIIKRRV